MTDQAGPRGTVPFPQGMCGTDSPDRPKIFLQR